MKPWNFHGPFLNTCPGYAADMGTRSEVSHEFYSYYESPQVPGAGLLPTPGLTWSSGAREHCFSTPAEARRRRAPRAPDTSFPQTVILADPAGAARQEGRCRAGGSATEPDSWPRGKGRREAAIMGCGAPGDARLLTRQLLYSLLTRR